MPFKNNLLFLAPLAGISETVFRGLCIANGADTVITEMVSAEGLLRNSKKTMRLMAFDETERPIGVQLFGSEPDRMAAAAGWIEVHVKPDYINLNSGCPVPKWWRETPAQRFSKIPTGLSGSSLQWQRQ